MLNGDVWTEYPYAQLRDRLQDGDLAHLVLVPIRRTTRRAISCCATVACVEGEEGERFTFSGIGVYHPDLFDGCRDGIFKLAPLLRAAARAGRVSAELYRGDWLDIGTPERLAALDRRLRGG